MTKTIEITITPKGETKISTSGFSGSACQDATRNIERALGAKTDEQLTGEYYAAANEQQIETQN